MDLTRDEAVLMLATLACSSDGQCDKAEEALIRKRLAPNLARLGAAGEERAFTRLYQTLGTRGQAHILKAIHKALPKLSDRIDAVRITLEIVRSDGSMTREEMEHVAELADELGLSEEDLRTAMAA